MKNIITFIIVSLETGTNFPAVNLKTLLAIAMMNTMQRWNSTVVPTQSQLHAASLTFSPWNISIQIQWQPKAMAIAAPAWGPTVQGTKKCQLRFRFYVKNVVYKSFYIQDWSNNIRGRSDPCHLLSQSRIYARSILDR